MYTQAFADYSDVEYVIDRWWDEAEDELLYDPKGSHLALAILNDLKDIVSISADEIHEYIE